MSPLSRWLEPSRSRWIAAGLVMVLVVALGWVSDDAYVTLRSVDMVWEGHGPVYNADERVQAYTHPLWFGLLCLSYGLTFGEAWWAAFLPCVLYTGIAVTCVLLAFNREPRRALIALGLLAGSRAFLEYGTSGLENPLTLAILAGMVAARRTVGTDSGRLGIVSLLAGFAVVNRLDTALLVGPLWAWTAWESRELGTWRVVRALALASLPLLAWEAFSIVYYGVPVPNTAYAKLQTGLPLTTKLGMGFTYLTHFAVHDPTGTLVLLGSLLAGLLSGDPRARPTMLSIALYCAYIVWIGGDFMAGRFLAAPVLLAALTLAGLPAPPEIRPRLLVISAWTLPLLLQVYLLFAPQRIAQENALVEVGPYEAVRLWGIVDERAYFRSTLGLPAVLANGGTPSRITRVKGEALRERARRADRTLVAMPAQAGVYAYYAGPEVIIVDIYGLGDPLVARLPMQTSARRQWAPGHYPRTLPEGYVESRGTRTNGLVDPDLRALWEELDRVVAKPLWLPARWTSIWRLNTGALDHHAEAWAERVRSRPDPVPDPVGIPGPGGP